MNEWRSRSGRAGGAIATALSSLSTNLNSLEITPWNLCLQHNRDRALTRGPHRRGQTQRFLDLNQPDNFIQALARVVRLTQADYRTGHYTTQPNGHALKHRDHTTFKIMVIAAKVESGLST